MTILTAFFEFWRDFFYHILGIDFIIYFFIAFLTLLFFFWLFNKFRGGRND